MSDVALVTGAAGFVGRHLVDHLAHAGQTVEAQDRAQLDLRDGEAVRLTVRALQPATIFHLAALASVRRSWAERAETLIDNLSMTVNVLEAVRMEAPRAAVLIVSSSEVYGKPAALPVDELAALDPRNPYAVSKAACDLLGAQYVHAPGIHVVRARPFNHAGPGQSDHYVIAALARQVAEAELVGGSEVSIRVGNLHSTRDFTHVKDVVTAYAGAIHAEPGVYNICSGVAVSVGQIVSLLDRFSSLSVRAESDPTRVREHEVKEVWGSAAKLTAATGWEPKISIEDIVRDALDDWRSRVASVG